MAIERYSHVMHIVSRVAGTLARGGDAVGRAARVASPRARSSGAPKIRAMQIIDELEPVKRGPYGGAVGYLSYTGDLDTCIYIRSALVKDGRVRARPARASWPTRTPATRCTRREAKAGAHVAASRLACEQGDWP